MQLDLNIPQIKKNYFPKDGALIYRPTNKPLFGVVVRCNLREFHIAEFPKSWDRSIYLRTSSTVTSTPPGKLINEGWLDLSSPQGPATDFGSECYYDGLKGVLLYRTGVDIICRLQEHFRGDLDLPLATSKKDKESEILYFQKVGSIGELSPGMLFFQINHNKIISIGVVVSEQNNRREVSAISFSPECLANYETGNVRIIQIGPNKIYSIEHLVSDRFPELDMNLLTLNNSNDSCTISSDGLSYLQNIYLKCSHCKLDLSTKEINQAAVTRSYNLEQEYVPLDHTNLIPGQIISYLSDLSDLQPGTKPKRLFRRVVEINTNSGMIQLKKLSGGGDGAIIPPIEMRSLFAKRKKLMLYTGLNNNDEWARLRCKLNSAN